MSQALFGYAVQKGSLNNPETIFQIATPTNQRAVLRAIEVMTNGATGATAPLWFAWCLQDGAGTSDEDSANIWKEPPACAETIQSTIRDNFSAEPANNDEKAGFSLHQQSSRLWVPPCAGNIFIIPGNTRYGLRIKTAFAGDVKVIAHFEE